MIERAHCENCKHSVKQPLRGPDGTIQIGDDVYTCHARPPTAVMLPATNVSGQGFALMSNFPPVDKTMYCALHEFDDAVEGVSPGLLAQN